MIENSKPQLIEATEEEIEANENKVEFPVAGVIVIGILLVLVIACIIVISILTAE